MKWLAIAVVVVACKGQEPAPSAGSGSGSGSGSAPVVTKPASPFAKVAPPAELAGLRLGMSFDQAARIAPAIVTSKDVTTTVAGMPARVTFNADVLDSIELTVPPGTEAMLAKQWGPPPWLDPTTGWYARYEAGALHFVAYVPDPDLMNQGARVLDHALRMLADPKLPVPKELLDMGPKANPFTLDVAGAEVRVGMPILSKRAALSSWLALLEQRWGVAKPTTPGHWTYAAPVKVDAHVDDLGVLELVLGRP